MGRRSTIGAVALAVLLLVVAAGCDGRPATWGANGAGQLGDGTTSTRTSPTAITPAAGWATVDGGGSHTCGTRTDGTLWCWGANTSGQSALEDLAGSTTVPQQVGTGWGTYREVSAGALHTCVLTTGGRIGCTGDNTHGQLGLGHRTGRLLIERVTSADTGWTDVTAGTAHSCAIWSGIAYCWGSGADGRLGDGTVGDRLAPVSVTTEPRFLPGSWTAVSAGFDHACGLRDDGSAWCWGDGSDGALGSGGTADQLRAVRVGTATDWTSIHAGTNATCGRRADATLWCWGDGGQVGDASFVDRPTPVAVGTGASWTSVQVDGRHTCARRSDGTLWCWGYGASGQLGDGRATPSSFPVQVGTATTWLTVATSTTRVDSAGAISRIDATCATRTDGSLWCWGDGSAGQLGDGTEGQQRDVPVRSDRPTRYAQLAAGGRHTCGTAREGDLWCWGDNASGQLGILAAGGRARPTRVPFLDGWTSVAAGAQHTCGIRGAGELRCWGAGGRGRLGVGGTGDLSAPWTPVVGAADWRSVSAGGLHTCGIRTAGSLWCWGSNAHGQIGDGTAQDRLAPTQVGTATDWTAVSAGAQHTCARRAAGTLWCWGLGEDGRLGHGDTLNRPVPTQVGTATTWASVSAGKGAHTCATRADRTLWCWGAGDRGQLGNGTVDTRLVPTPASLAGVTAVSAGGLHTCALNAGGYAVCVGDGGQGQLGDGGTGSRTTWYVAGPRTDWRTISAGELHTVGTHG